MAQTNPPAFSDEGEPSQRRRKPVCQAMKNRGNFLESEETSTPVSRTLDLKFEQWPHVSRFKNRKTSFRREAITGSTHSRHVTDLLSESDQATSIQDWDDAGSFFGCTRMEFETLEPQTAKGFLQIMKSKVKRTFRVASLERQKWHFLELPLLRTLQNMAMLSRREISPSSISVKVDRQPSPKKAPQGKQAKDSSVTTKHTSRGQLSATPKWMNGPRGPKGKSDDDMKVAYDQECNPCRGVLQRVWHERLPTSPDF